MEYKVGVDEVGRGCLAGPLLVVGAKQTSDLPNGLRDSKLLTRNQRAKLLNLLSSCCEFSEGWVTVSEIDRFGLGNAMRLGVKRALNGMEISAEEVIIMDGKVNYIPKKFKNAKCIVDADNLVPIVSAASIYAKATRDNYMFELSSKYPKYGFDSHVGYGTTKHLDALKAIGIIAGVHRTSFKPVSIMAVSS